VYAVVVVGAEERRRERSGRVARRILGVCRVVDFVVYWSASRRDQGARCSRGLRSRG
jgi:hypothetical protein